MQMLQSEAVAIKLIRKGDEDIIANPVCSFEAARAYSIGELYIGCCFRL